MSIIIGFLTAVLVLNCLLLILLVLIQLPKKEAGAGIAFGGGATEALFGAGSGNVLTKVTKYAAGIFMGLALLLAIFNAQSARRGARSLEMELERKAAAASQSTPSATQPSVTPDATPTIQLTTTNEEPPAAAPAEPNVPAEQP